MEDHEIYVGSDLRYLGGEVVGVPPDAWEVVFDVPSVNADSHSWFLSVACASVVGQDMSLRVACALRQQEANIRELSANLSSRAAMSRHQASRAPLSAN